ncbi:MAG: hypothetical protein JZU65_15460 [Chlorobium sp.]|nr:hypothetical protein [Chlorobium sp.]
MLSASQVEELNSLFAVELAMVHAATKSPGKWECVLTEMLVGDYAVIPLTSTKMLTSESYWMQNCCWEYACLCADLEYSIFSIRSRFGKRLATLGIGKEGRIWYFDQCFGPRNTQVLESMRDYTDEEGFIQNELSATDIYYLAHEVVRLMNSHTLNSFKS